MPQNVVIECAAHGTYQFYIHTGTTMVIGETMTEGSYVAPRAWETLGGRLDLTLIGQAIVTGVTDILGVTHIMVSNRSLRVITHNHANNQAILMEVLKIIRQEIRQDLLAFIKSEGHDNRRNIGVFSGAEISLPLAEFTLEPLPLSRPRHYKKPPSRPLW